MKVWWVFLAGGITLFWLGFLYQPRRPKLISPVLKMDPIRYLENFVPKLVITNNASLDSSNGNAAISNLDDNMIMVEAMISGIALEKKNICLACKIPLVAVTTSKNSDAASVYQLSQKGILVIIVADLDNSEFTYNKSQI